MSKLIGKGNWYMKSGFWRDKKAEVKQSMLYAAVFLGVFFVMPLRVQAYFGVDGDYFLRTEKPEGRSEGHYFEFVNPDVEAYVVQAGDTLWGIAEAYYGSGTAYPKLWEDNKELVDMPETLQIGTRLKIQERLYTAAGMQDYIHDEVMNLSRNVKSAAWEWEPEEEDDSWRIFQTVTYRNDFGEMTHIVNGKLSNGRRQPAAERSAAGGSQNLPLPDTG